MGQAILLSICVVHAGHGIVRPKRRHSSAVLLQDLLIVALHIHSLCDGSRQLLHHSAELPIASRVNYSSL